MIKRYLNVFKAIKNGVWGYYNDRNHDRHYDAICGKYYQWVCDDIGDDKFIFVASGHWKEGSLWYYIKQSLIGSKRKGYWESMSKYDFEKNINAMLEGLKPQKSTKYVRKGNGIQKRVRQNGKVYKRRQKGRR